VRALRRGAGLVAAALLLAASPLRGQALRWESAEKEGHEPRYEAFARVRIDLTGFVDAYGMQGTDTFNFASILPPDAPGRDEARLWADLRSSRLAFGATARPGAGLEIRSYVETDFWGPDRSLTVRLRKAWVEAKGVLAGQELTSFGDSRAGPRTADGDGPPTGVWTRSVMLRYSRAFAASRRFAVSLEMPKADVTYLPDQAPGIEPAYERLPDLTANVSQAGEWGHVQLSGVLRELRYRAPGGTRAATGGGVAASGTVRLLRSPAKSDALYYQGVVGKGIGRYLVSLAGLAADAIPDFDGGLVALPAWGGYVAYERRWAPGLWSTAVLGGMRLVNDSVVPGGDFLDGRLVMVNTFATVAPGLDVGAEVDWGRRVDKDGLRAEALRITFTGRYEF
jgi:hypothetical protein